MLFYFSGTGNSKLVAQHLAMLTQDFSYDMTKYQAQPYVPVTTTSLGFVIPVYAWGLPLFVETFFRKVLPSILPATPDITYVYAVFTCGGNIGYADEELRKLLLSFARLPLHAVWSVRMPNTYVCMPFYDADYGKSAAKKLKETHSRLLGIADAVIERKKEINVVRGLLPSFKTGPLRRLFNRKLVTDIYFYVCPDRCVSCGLCAKSCPCHNISMIPTEPYIVWKGEECTGCLRCFHYCPTNAIQFGPYTKNKHQYRAPQSFTE